MDKSTRRYFSPAEKIKAVEKIMSGELDYRDVRDSDGEPVHYGIVQGWIRKYKAGEFGSRYMTRAHKADQAAVENTFANVKSSKKAFDTDEKNFIEQKKPETKEKPLESIPTPQEFVTRGAGTEDVAELWKYIFSLWKFIFELQSENDQLKGSKKGDRPKASALISQLAPMFSKSGGE